MTLEFQQDILRFLCTSRECKKLLADIEPSIFDLPEYGLVLDILKGYVKKYNTLPTKSHLIEFFKKQVKNTPAGVKEEIQKAVLQAIDNSYLTPGQDIPIIKETVLEFVMKAKFKHFSKKWVSGIKGINDFDSMRKEMTAISRIPESLHQAETVSLLTDGAFFRPSTVPVHATKFYYMNQVQKTKGFKPPEVIVIMAGPKAGKTTLMINLAQGFLADGKKIAYFDTENGVQRIKIMMYQCIMDCDYDSLENDSQTQDDLATILGKYQKLGGELKIHALPPRRASTDDVEVILERWKDEDGFVPDIVICDYFDNMVPSTKTKERRLDIQGVYFDWKNLAEIYQFPVITPSQVNRAAVEKEVFSVKDVGEDFGKVANCDSLWAYCRTETEKKEGLARLVIVANRDGKDTGTVYLNINPETCRIEESEINKRREAVRKSA